jgi:hypothetical protein
MIKYPFYQLYSWWVISLFILYILRLIKFSILPSVLLTFIFTIFFVATKYYKSDEINIKLAIIIILIHFIPFYIIPFNINIYDLYYNLLIFILYLITLQLQNTNVFEVYSKLLNEQSPNVSIYGYYKDLGILK